MKCFRLRCYVNNSFLVFHQGTKHSKTIKHSRFALVFHTVFSCLDPLMKHSNSLFTYNIQQLCQVYGRTLLARVARAPKPTTVFVKTHPTSFQSWPSDALVSYEIYEQKFQRPCHKAISEPIKRLLVNQHALSEEQVNA